jgi:hypothetical protein
LTLFIVDGIDGIDGILYIYADAGSGAICFFFFCIFIV